jgi:hypothetical protein
MTDSRFRRHHIWLAKIIMIRKLNGIGFTSQTHSGVNGKIVAKTRSVSRILAGCCDTVLWVLKGPCIVFWGPLGGRVQWGTNPDVRDSLISRRHAR